MTKSIQAAAPHRLEVWRVDNNLQVAEIAKRFDVHVRTYDRWIEGTNFPTLEKAQHVFVETDGFVSVMDWKTPFLRKMSDKARASAKRSKGQTKLPTPVAKPVTPRKKRPAGRRLAKLSTGKQ